MTIFWILLALFLGTTVLSGFATFLLINWLNKNQIMAMPNERSCHTIPTPVGGGWILFCFALLVWVFTISFQDLMAVCVLFGMSVLAIISWLDDKNFVSPLLRFCVQIGVVALVMVVMPQNMLVFSGFLPFWLDHIVIGFLWIWFINLYNFMDGIDGMAGVETFFISLGICCIGLITGLDRPVILTSMTISGASAGFLWWNWNPAKIFMGDVGSITMGFLLGWFLIVLATHGYLLAALILPLYFLVDATYTLLKRIAAREKFWQPHKTHFYQKVCLVHNSHSFVVKKIIIANLFLLGAAIFSVSNVMIAVMSALITISVLMVHFYSLSK